MSALAGAPVRNVRPALLRGLGLTVGLCLFGCASDPTARLAGGREASRTEPSASTLAALAGNWTVVAFRQHWDEKLRPGVDTPAYLGREARFSTRRLGWSGDAPGGHPSRYEVCLGPSLTPVIDAAALIRREDGELPLGVAADQLRKPAYRISCEGGVGGFHDALFIVTARNEMLMSWYEEGLLTLRRARIP